MYYSILLKSKSIFFLWLKNISYWFLTLYRATDIQIKCNFSVQGYDDIKIDYYLIHVIFKHKIVEDLLLV